MTKIFNNLTVQQNQRKAIPLGPSGSSHCKISWGQFFEMGFFLGGYFLGVGILFWVFFTEHQSVSLGVFFFKISKVGVFVNCGFFEHF